MLRLLYRLSGGEASAGRKYSHTQILLCNCNLQLRGCERSGYEVRERTRASGGQLVLIVG